MIRKLLLAGAAAIMLMPLNAVAYADAITLVQGQSVTFTYQSSQFEGSNARATFTLQGNQLIINYTNTSTNETFLTGIGLNTSPNLSIDNVDFSPGSTWQFGTHGGGMEGFDLRVFGGGTDGPLSSGQSGTATLTLNAIPQSVTIDLTAAHLTNLPNGGSEQPVGAIVPEPATMLLLGTGLAGVAAMVRKRRKLSKK